MADALYTPKYFKFSEFDQKDGQLPGSGRERMQPHFLAKLDQLREKFGQPITISSGYRSPAYNKKVGGVGDSAHCNGIAADLKCLSSKDRYRLVKLAIEVGFTGIGIAKSFVHVDLMQKEAVRPGIWTY